MRKIKYEKAVMEIINFDVEDILTDSVGENDNVGKTANAGWGDYTGDGYDDGEGL